VDHSEIGRMAAQHLNGRGYRQYAFVGGIDHDHAKQRYLAFREQLSSSELNLHLFSESFPPGGTIRPSDPITRRYRERFALWLEALPKPIGLFAVDDWMAYETHLACRKLGLRIPNDVAIVGVNDDDITCQMATPRLTSIRLPWERIGMEAGKLLLERIQGLSEATSRVLSPVGLVARESTNAFAVKDKVVEQALRYMQKESIRPIRVEEVLKHVGVSRSLLERRFRGEIGRTPLVELRRQRVERARGLLADTELAINRISELCGFASNIRFTTVFREQVGITPTEFRSQMQLSE
jgi:LacI family transcriptional regulator